MILSGQVADKQRSCEVVINPMGIYGSPYGEVIAMGLQGGIDRDFQGSLGASPVSVKNDHPNSWMSPFVSWIKKIDRLVEERTNHKSMTNAHRQYLRMKVEDRLRLAYRLDPSNYANYNSLHLFITEPSLGKNMDTVSSAVLLAEETIEYCLAKEDPMAALTAAAAASNLVEIRVNDLKKRGAKDRMDLLKNAIAELDRCIQKHQDFSRNWDDINQWSHISENRIKECQERLVFVRKFRNDAVDIFRSLNQKSKN